MQAPVDESQAELSDGEQLNSSEPGGSEKRSSSAVKFDSTLSVGVAATSAKSGLLRSAKAMKAKAISKFGGAPLPPSSSDDSKVVQNLVQVPARAGARFDSTAMPARPALKSSSGTPSSIMSDSAFSSGPQLVPPLPPAGPHRRGGSRDGSAAAESDDGQPWRQRQHSAPASMGGSVGASVSPVPTSPAGAVFLSALGGSLPPSPSASASGIGTPHSLGCSEGSSAFRASAPSSIPSAPPMSPAATAAATYASDDGIIGILRMKYAAENDSIAAVTATPAVGGAAAAAAAGAQVAGAAELFEGPPYGGLGRLSPEITAKVPSLSGSASASVHVASVNGVGFKGSSDVRVHCGGPDTSLETDQGGGADKGRSERPGAGGGGGGGGPRDDASAALSGAIVPPGSSRPLPGLSEQLTFRALAAGLVVGFAFALLAQRLVLVAGLVPSFQVAIAAGCWVVLRGYTLVLGRDMTCITPLHSQEVAVASAAALACAGSVVAGGFGPVIEALSRQAFDAVGSGPRTNLVGETADLGYWRAMVWLLLVGAAGGLVVVPFRRALLGRPSVTFPTGAATGQLINTMHTPGMSFHGRKQMAHFAQWSLISLGVSGYQWIFNNPLCDGFSSFPTFGLTLAKWRWLFDFQMPLVGVGMMAPLGVAWSMVAGAVLSWGVLWPVLDGRAGAWYPSNLSSYDARGLFGYQITLAVALVMSDGLYTVLRGCISYVTALCRRIDAAAAGDLGAHGALPAQRPAPRRRWQAEALAAMESDTLSDASTLQFSLAAVERGLRRHLFMSDDMRGWSPACLGAAAALLVAAAAALPPLLALPGPQWYHLLTAAAVAPVAAMANARATGTTDMSMAAAFAGVARTLFAAWGGAGTGLTASGLMLGAAHSAAELGSSLAAGYSAMARPTAIVAAHLIGTAGGALLAPLSYALLAPQLPLSPLAAPARAAAALFAEGGLQALPLFAGWMALAALVVGLALAGIRDTLQEKAKVLVPIPAVMGVIFLTGANVAVGVTFGAAVRIAWRWRSPRNADAYAALVGSALIAGDGVWSLGRGLLGAFGVKAPICMNFSPAPSF